MPDKISLAICHINAPVLALDLAVRVCHNVNMKLRIAAICAIVAFATYGDRAPAQFPGCAHLSIEIQAECQPEAREWYVVNDRTDGQVEVTIHVTLLDVVSGVSTSTDQVLTLAAGERRKLGCVLTVTQTRYNWTLVGCQPL